MNPGAAWTDEEIKALISIWGDSKVQQELDGAVRNKSIFVKVQNELEKQGYKRSWQQCRSKIKNLKTQYRKVKDHNGGTGRGRTTCKFFKELDQILGHRPASTPAILVDTGIATAGSSSESQLSEPEEKEDCLTGKEGIDIAVINIKFCHFVQH